MTYVVVENCIKCKYMDCVEVCPVDCFYEGDNMLVIHPDECIDCGVCEPECPAEAIKPDSESGLEKWLELNAQYAKNWPNITVKREPPADAKDWDGVPDKCKKFLSADPGAGDRIYFPWRHPCRASGLCRRALTDSGKLHDCCIRIAVLGRHKALILPKNVLYI